MHQEGQRHLQREGQVPAAPAESDRLKPERDRLARYANGVMTVSQLRSTELCPGRNE